MLCCVTQHQCLALFFYERDTNTLANISSQPSEKLAQLTSFQNKSKTAAFSHPIVSSCQEKIFRMYNIMIQNSIYWGYVKIRPLHLIYALNSQTYTVHSSYLF